LGYSFIKNAALQIGGEILQVNAGGGYTIDGVAPSTAPSVFGGTYNFQVTTLSYGTTYEVTLGGGQYVIIGEAGGSLYIQVHGKAGDFADSGGMGGNLETGGLMLRDGVTNVAGDTDAGSQMGQDWRWLTSDPVLLQDPIEPEVAICPENPNFSCVGEGCAGGQGRLRKLQPDTGNECPTCLEEGEAEDICEAAGVEEGPLRVNCVFDVETTGNATWATYPWGTQCFEKGSRCAELGGKCVMNCVANKRSTQCIPGLCTFKGKKGRGRPQCACEIKRE
jgi:hypothetical protein